MGTSRAIRVWAAHGLTALCAACVFGLPAEAGAHAGSVADQVVTTYEPAADGDGVVAVSRHLDPIEEVTSDRGLHTAAVTSGARGKQDRGLSTVSCTGVPRSTDDTANAYHSASSRVIKVIYAFPTDVGNRLTTYSPVIQSGLRWVSELVAGESGNRKSLRFDLGTSAGAGCVDIQSVALSRTASAYTANPSQTFSLLRNELQPKVNGQLGNPNFVVYADGVGLQGIGGEAQVRSDDSAAGSQQGLGNLWGMVYGRGGSDFVGSSTAFAPGTTSRAHVDIVLHEISHTLGAVQKSAPHRSAAFHCTDEYDVLCYDDDGNGGISTFLACNSAGSQSWDCNKDDYFNAVPAPGSYLDTHWNLYDSVFLCPSSSCAPGGITGPPAADVPFESAPETMIVSKPRRKSSNRTAVFRFTSSAHDALFRCQLNRGEYRPCKSPMTVRNLRTGSYRFSVYSYIPSPWADRGGEPNSDSSPAQTTFKVKAKKK